MQRSQFRQCNNIWLRTTKTVVGAHHFTHIKPLRLDIAFAQDFNKQQSRHQFAVADQFIRQCRRCCQCRRFGQNSNVLQQTFNLFTDDVRVTQTLQNGELNIANSIEFFETLNRFQTFSQCNQQIGNPRRSREHNQTNIHIRKHNVGAAVHGVEISHASTTKFGDNNIGHNNLVSGNERSDLGTKAK